MTSFGPFGLYRGVFYLKIAFVARPALRNRRLQLRNCLARCKRGAAAFMASLGPFWLRVRVRGWVFARTFIPTGSKIPEQHDLMIRAHRL